MGPMPASRGRAKRHRLDRLRRHGDENAAQIQFPQVHVRLRDRDPCRHRNSALRVRLSSSTPARSPRPSPCRRVSSRASRRGTRHHGGLMPANVADVVDAHRTAGRNHRLAQGPVRRRRRPEMWFRHVHVAGLADPAMLHRHDRHDAPRALDGRRPRPPAPTLRRSGTRSVFRRSWR